MGTYQILWGFKYLRLVYVMGILTGYRYIPEDDLVGVSMQTGCLVGVTSILAGDGLKPPASRSHDIKYIFFLVGGTCNMFETSDEIYTLYRYIYDHICIILSLDT
jgi:hypothetical protein